MSQQSPLLGYNNNIPYKGRMYHVQTEDSGVKRPHIITHLFADGGRVVTSKKISYAELLETATDLEELVRQMMKDQHKGMVISLRDGEFDHIIAQDNGGAEPEREAVREIPVEVLERAAAMAERELIEGFRALARAAAARARQRRPESPAPPATSPVRALPGPAAEPGKRWVFAEKLLSRRTLDRVMLEFLNEQVGPRTRG